MDFIGYLFMDSILGFMFYITGAYILKALTFGNFELEAKNFAMYRTSKKGGYSLPVVTGLTFYLLLFALIITSSN